MAGKNGENVQREEEKPPARESDRKVKKKPIRVKYISSPMMVKANNALEFKAIVQQLTGQDSPASAASSAASSVASPHSNSQLTAFSFSDDVEQAYLWADFDPKGFLGFPPLRF